MSMSPKFVRPHKKAEILVGSKSLRKRTRIGQLQANQLALTELVGKQLKLLERYRPALERIANIDNWDEASHQWKGNTSPLTIAQEALKVEVKENKDALHQTSPEAKA